MNKLLVLILIGILVILLIKPTIPKSTKLTVPESNKLSEPMANTDNQICSSLCCCNRKPTWRNVPIVSKPEGGWQRVQPTGIKCKNRVGCQCVK